MKKFITSIAAFLALIIVFYPVTLFVWGICISSGLRPNLNYPIGISGHQYSRLKEVKNIHSVDILFVGPSLAYRGFDPRIFEANGITSFNLGSSNQTPVQTKVLLKRYLRQINPKLIIYEVEPETFSVDGVESSLDIMANDKNDLNSIRMAVELNHIKVYNTLIYSLIRDALSLNSSFNEPMIKGEDKYVAGGFVEKEIRFYKKVSCPSKTWDFNENQLIAFKEVVNLIKHHGSELILVNAPITPSLYRSYMNSSIFDHLMSDNSKYYNFNEILPLNDSLHFYDAFHLNQNGVKLFDSKLIELLKENQALFIERLTTVEQH